MSATFTVLLVEDNSDDEELTRRVLLKLDAEIEVEVARDGEQAIETLLAPDLPLPNLVLLDLRLPGMGGMDVLARLRDNERTTNLPVVVMASLDELGDIREGCEKLSNGSITKPVSGDTFLALASSLGFDLGCVN